MYDMSIVPHMWAEYEDFTAGQAGNLAPVAPVEAASSASSASPASPLAQHSVDQQGLSFFDDGGNGGGPVIPTQLGGNNPYIVGPVNNIPFNGGFVFGSGNNNNNNNFNIATNRYEYGLTSTHLLTFALLPQPNPFQPSYELSLQVHAAAVIDIGRVEEQPVDPTQYQYIIWSDRPILLGDSNVLQSARPIMYQARAGALNNPMYPPPLPAASASAAAPSLPLPFTHQPLHFPPIAAENALTSAEATPAGPVEPVQAPGAVHRPRARGGRANTTARRRKTANAWTENAVVKPIWDTDSRGNRKHKEDGCAPTHYQCKVCQPSAPKHKKRRTGNGVATSDNDNATELKPFIGRWGEQRRHFQSSRPGHLDAWNEANGENQTKVTCTFPIIDPSTGRAERDEDGNIRTCGYTHGRADHAVVDHMASVHNAEAPGDHRAHSTDVAYLGRKRVDCRRDIVRTELEALSAVRRRIQGLEEELVGQRRDTDTPYVSVHGLDVVTDWKVAEGKEAEPETIVRVRTLANQTGRRQFRSALLGSWHQVADDLEAGLRPGSRRAQALDFARQSQAGEAEGGRAEPKPSGEGERSDDDDEEEEEEEEE